MSKEEAVRKALEYIQAMPPLCGPVVDVHRLDLEHLDGMAKDCPADLIATYTSVRSKFRNQWIISFKIPETPGQVSCPETAQVCVFDNGEVALFPSL